MYHVVSKGRHYGPKQNQYLMLKGSIESRDDARAFARGNDGSVKTDAELTQMIGDGKINIPATSTTQEPQVQPNPQNQFPGAAQQPADQSTNPNPPPEAPEQGNAPTGSGIVDAATQVAGEQAKRTTVGKKAKPEPKRVKTSEEVLAAARAHIEELAPKVKDGTMSKVDFVRDIALWNDRKLQRSDAILLTAAAQLGISPATVSTQFQFARSDRMKDYSDRASKREEEAAQREAKKAEQEAERAKKKQERETEAKKKADAKEAERQKREADKKAKEEAAAAEKQRKADEKAAKEQQEAGEQPQAE